MSESVAIPERVRSEIRRIAVQPPQAAYGRDAAVEPEHQVEVEIAMNSLVERQERAVRDWRDQVLLRILAVSESLLTTNGVSLGNSPLQSEDDAWMETEQVAAYLNLTPKTVREGAARGTLPGHKYPAKCIRGRWRFKKDELDRSLIKRCGSRNRAVEQSVWN